MNETNAIIPYQAQDISNLSDMNDLARDLGSMANSFDKMGFSITLLTDFANRKLEELMEIVPPKEVLIPVSVVGGLLLSGYLISGIVANVKAINKK